MSRTGDMLLSGGVFVIVFVGASLVLAYKDLRLSSGFIQASPGDKAKGVLFAAHSRTTLADRQQPDISAIELQVLRERAADEGASVSDELIAHARNDAPAEPLQVRYAELPGKEGGRLICSSMRVQGAVTHFAMTFTSSEVHDDEQALLPEYILSGCAAAVRDRSIVVSSAEFARRMIPLVPADKRYAPIRREYEDIAAGR